jgi:hypothetical protein
VLVLLLQLGETGTENALVLVLVDKLLVVVFVNNKKVFVLVVSNSTS